LYYQPQQGLWQCPFFIFYCYPLTTKVTLSRGCPCTLPRRVLRIWLRDFFILIGIATQQQQQQGGSQCCTHTTLPRWQRPFLFFIATRRQQLCIIMLGLLSPQFYVSHFFGTTCCF
jgi:hypothetical protein